jgi:iron complex outermembrane receptor protein
MDDGRALAMARVAGAVADGVTLASRVYGRADLLDTQLAAVGAQAIRQRGGAGGADLEARVAHAGGALALSVEAADEGYRSASLGGTRTRATLAAAADEAWFAVPGRLRIEPAVRVERVGPFRGTSAKLGVSLRLVDGLSVRASAGRTFRVPSFAELFLEQGLLAPNPDLRPEVGIGADAALAYEGALGVASLGGHATVYDDLITYEPASFGRFKPFNTGRAVAAGLEVEGATAPARRFLGLSFQGAYTLLHTETLRGPPAILGKALPRRPRHDLRARAAISPGRLGAHVDARVVRDTWKDSLNEGRVPDETVFSAGASVLLVRAPRVTLHVEVENIADVRSLEDGFGQPLPGRTLMVSLRAGTSKEGTP